ncbi:hypothetical protein ACH5RR_002475 [Cinchona calisaya]|uniref:Uncharacterized protein n=1 Tax=Cinchona calisaya TaxID=153742 RepID=A0ABD3B6N3_9GENT
MPNPHSHMEIASIKPHDQNFDYPLSRNNTKSFLGPAANNQNCISAPEFSVSDIEMIAFEAAANYTSLKDLLPTSPSTIMSPTTNNSWREIPIKDPLLQHAAWAYLQPMKSDDHEVNGSRSFIRKLKDQWCGVFGCFNDVVLVLVKSWFSATGIKEELNGQLGEDDKFE